MMRKCELCGKRFAPANNRQIYCSAACARRVRNRRANARMSAARAAARTGRVCPVCGKPFTPKNARGTYCSPKCANAKFRVLAKHDPKPCAWCGREFTPVRSNQMYCCRECNLASRGNSRKGTGIAIRKVGRAVPGEPSASLARVRAYLALPPAERYARRGELTKAEHALAQRLYLADHPVRTVATNDLAH